MTTDKIPAAKRAYSRPTLLIYGDVATLTKGGTGSTVEAGNSNSKDRT